MDELKGQWFLLNSTGYFLFEEDLQSFINSSLSLSKKKLHGGLEFHLCFWKNKTMESLTVVYGTLVPDKLKILLDYILLKSSENNTTSLLEEQL